MGESSQLPVPSSSVSDTTYGYRLINMNLLSGLFRKLMCPSCSTTSIHLRVRPVRGSGINAMMLAHCVKCDSTIASAPTSETASGNQTSSASIRTVASARNCGFGYQQLTHFMAGLDVPQIMHRRTYQRIAHHVHDAAITCMDQCYSKAVEAVRAYYCEMDKSLGPDSIIPIVVSFDGTWHKRGHSSHYGVGVIIELHTGLVLDSHVVSNYCMKCTRKPDPTHPTYDQWCEGHKTECRKNFNGSSVAMEVEAAKVVFGRSVAMHKLYYQTCLCDGDAKTIMTLNKMQIYPQPVKKEDCINHIAKRMKSGIMNLRKSLMGTKDSISGKKKGQVTEKIATKLTNYYADALKRNTPNLQAMKNAVYASIHHMSSTDEQPNHTMCPEGKMSWCIYQRETYLNVKDDDRTKHKGELSMECAKLLEPLYNRLTKPDLLERCIRMKTQNANECFNSQVWMRCPKGVNTSLSTVETAVAMASLDFNCGATGYSKLLEELSIDSGSHLTRYITSCTARRITNAAKKSSESVKKSRKRHKLVRAGLADKRNKTEGLLYKAGGFNE